MNESKKKEGAKARASTGKSTRPSAKKSGVQAIVMGDRAAKAKLRQAMENARKREHAARAKAKEIEQQAKRKERSLRNKLKELAAALRAATQALRSERKSAREQAKAIKQQEAAERKVLVRTLERKVRKKYQSAVAKRQEKSPRKNEG